MWRLAAVCILLVLVVLGCSGSPGTVGSGSTSGTAQTTPPAPPPPAAGVSATLVRLANGDLQFVDPAPEGSQPAAGLAVRVVNLAGQVLATGVTGPDGRVSFESLAGDQAELQVGEGPDARLPLSLVPDAHVVGGAVLPIDRAEAADAVFAVAPAGARVVLTFQPLPPGTRVQPAFGDANGDTDESQVHTVGGPRGEYLGLIDPTPADQWSHEVEYVFVDAETGAVTRQPAFWLPAVNDILYFSYTEQLVFDVPGDQVAVSGQVLQNVPPAPVPRVQRKTTAAVEPDPDLFGFLWVGTSEDWYVRDGVRMRQWLLAQGVPEGNILESLPYDRDDPGQDAAAKMAILAERIQARKDAGGSPTLFAFAVSHGTPSGRLVGFNSLLGQGLDKLGLDQFPASHRFAARQVLPLHLVPACRIRVLLSCCWASSHIEDLKGLFGPADPQDVEIYTSSGTNKGTGTYHLLNIPADRQSGGLLFALASYVASDSAENGTDTVRKWVERARLDEQGRVLGVDGLFNPYGGPTPTGEQLYRRPSPDRPQIDSFSPSEGKAGDQVIVEGSGLGGLGAEVRIGGVAATVLAGSETQLLVQVPVTVTGRIEVTNGCHTAESDSSFRYVVLGERFTIYNVTERWEVQDAYDCPEHANVPQSGEEDRYLYVRNDGAFFYRVYATNSLGSTIDAQGAFQMIYQEGTEEDGYRKTASGVLGPEGAFDGPVTERSTSPFKPDCPVDQRTVRYVWTPVRTYYDAQLILDYDERCPSNTGPAGAEIHFEYKEAAGALRIDFTTPLSGFSPRLTGQTANGAFHVTGSASGHVLTLDGVMQGDGTVAGTFTFTHPDSGCTDTGEFRIVPFCHTRINP